MDTTHIIDAVETDDGGDFSTPHAVQYKRLIDLYGIPAERRGGWLVEMAETFDAYPEEGIERAVNRYRKDYQPLPGAYVLVPPPGTFAGWVYQATDDLEAEARGARTPSDDLALPAPITVCALPVPSDTPEPEPPASHAWMAQRAPAAADRDAWDRNLAIGAARMRKRKALIEDWRRQQGPAHDWHTAIPENAWKGLDEPTPADVDAQLVAMQQKQGSPLAEAEIARQQTRRGIGRMRFEWKDGELRDVTLSHLGNEVPLTERASEPKNKAILKQYDHTPPYNERDYDRDRAKFKAKAAAEAGGKPGA